MRGGQRDFSAHSGKTTGEEQESCPGPIRHHSAAAAAAAVLEGVSQADRVDCVMDGLRHGAWNSAHRRAWLPAQEGPTGGAWVSRHPPMAGGAPTPPAHSASPLVYHAAQHRTHDGRRWLLGPASTHPLLHPEGWCAAMLSAGWVCRPLIGARDQPMTPQLTTPQLMTPVVDLSAQVQRHLQRARCHLQRARCHLQGARCHLQGARYHLQGAAGCLRAKSRPALGIDGVCSCLTSRAIRRQGGAKAATWADISCGRSSR